jgi:hypothetical protein
MMGVPVQKRKRFIFPTCCAKGESNSFQKGGKKGSNVGVLPLFFGA